MADDLKVKVTGIVEADEQKSGNMIASQMERISEIVNSKSRIKVAVEIDEKAIKKVASVIGSKGAIKAETTELRAMGEMYAKMAEMASKASTSHNGLRKIIKDVEFLKTKDKTGMLDWGLFNNAIDTGDLKQARVELDLLSKTFRNVSAQMYRDLPSQALENLPSRIDDTNAKLQILENNLKNLQSQGMDVPDDLFQRITVSAEKLRSVLSEPITNESVGVLGSVQEEFKQVD